MDFDLWTYPLPEVSGEPSWVTLGGLVPISETWKAGKLISKVPQVLRNCVAKVAAKDGDTSRAFAICTATLQKSGKLKKGTQKLTKKGRDAAGQRGKRPDAKDKDLDYERLIKAARKD